METTQLAIVGGGLAGVSAALQAVEAGLHVTLIDEHPLDFSMMAQDIPLHFGQRMLPTVGNRASMLSRVIAANPRLQEADEAGVDLRLGVSVWDSGEGPNGFLTLADETHSWRLKYDRVIFATGARDLGVAFQGWDKAGVVGAGAVLALLEKYLGFAGQRMVVLGSGGLGLTVAHKAIEAGVHIVGIVDISSDIRGPRQLRAALEEQGVPLYTSHAISEARGTDEVTSVIIAELDRNGRLLSGGSRKLECDTVCLAIGMVPSIELLCWMGCDLEFEPSRGGFVPRLHDNMRTTTHTIYVAGDAAAFTEEGFVDSSIAEGQGRAAAIAAAASLGALTPENASSMRIDRVRGIQTDSTDTLGYQQSWVHLLRHTDEMDVPVCLCEMVTRRDILQMIDRGPLVPDHFKRLTRAGMGYCQGRRCREQIQMLTAEAIGVEVSEVPLASYRPPFRPLPLRIIENQNLDSDERAFMEANSYLRSRRALTGEG